jgi:TetR/AcrR family transcriptional repressor of bet genes
MARPSNRDERRAQIADTFVTVMAERGYDGASIQEIAARAGIASGILHYHFRSKLDIMLHALERLSEQHLQRVEDAMNAAGASSWDRVRAFVGLHVGKGSLRERDQMAFWVVATGEALRNQEVAVAVDRLLGSLVHRLRVELNRGIDDIELSGLVDVEAASSAIVAAIQGYLVMAAVARAHIPAGSAQGQMEAMAAGLLMIPRDRLSQPGRSSQRVALAAVGAEPRSST